MKKPPTPGKEAKARLKKLGEPAIADFIGEVSDLKNLVQYLPTVPGFRKSSQAGIDRQRKELARRLCVWPNKKSGADDRDYRALYTVWRAWVLERLGDRKPINAAIDAIEEATSGSEGTERTKDAETAIVALFSLFQKSSEKGKCSREDIERALQFSPFDPSETLHGLITASRSAADIKRSAQYEELPDRLSKDEDDIKAVKAQLKDFGQRLERLASAVDGWPVHRTGLSSIIDDLRVSLERRLDELEARKQDTRVQVVSNQSIDAIRLVSERVDDLARQIDALPLDSAKAANDATERVHQRLNAIEMLLNSDSTIADMTSRLKALEDRLTREIEIRLSGTIDPSILERLNSIEDALTGAPSPPTHDVVAEMMSRVKAIEVRLESELQDRPSDGTDPGLLERLAGIEDTLARRPSPTSQQEGSASVQIDPSVIQDFSPISVEAIAHHVLPDTKQVSTLAGVAAPVAEMFQSLGLKASAAKALSEEICVALLLGQVVFLKGAYATEAARMCASLLCHNNAYRLALPLGFQQADDIRRAVHRSLSAAKESLSAVVIEGVNLAAFEVCKDVLAEFAADQPGQTAGGALVIATISLGVASLPFETAYLELGPIIDLDCLDWRSMRPVPRDLTSPTLSIAETHAIRSTLTAKSVDTDEPLKLVRAFLPRRNPRIEHSVLSAFTALTAHRKESDVPTALQSLTYGWLLPLWTAQAAPRSEVDNQIDGGKCDAAAPDPRIKFLLDDLSIGPERRQS